MDGQRNISEWNETKTTTTTTAHISDDWFYLFVNFYFSVVITTPKQHYSSYFAFGTIDINMYTYTVTHIHIGHRQFWCVFIYLVCMCVARRCRPNERMKQKSRHVIVFKCVCVWVESCALRASSRKASLISKYDEKKITNKNICLPLKNMLSLLVIPTHIDASSVLLTDFSVCMCKCI